MRAIFLLVAIVILQGCTSTLQVTYLSDPPGAALYQGNQRMGYTPQVLSYSVSSEEMDSGYKVVAGTSVRWVSGASAKIDNLKADIGKYGMRQTYTFIRPNDVQGREQDEQFALEIFKTNAAIQQVNEQRKQEIRRQEQIDREKQSDRMDRLYDSYMNSTKRRQEQAPQQTDYQCLTDCRNMGYLDAFCRKRCAY